MIFEHQDEGLVPSIAILGLIYFASFYYAYIKDSPLSSAMSAQAEKMHPTYWSIPNGRILNFGDRAAAVVGQDTCRTAFGSHSCWRYSTTPGSQQLITLSDGTQEIWTTVDTGKNRIYIERPNGMRVGDTLPMNGFGGAQQEFTPSERN